MKRLGFLVLLVMGFGLPTTCQAETTSPPALEIFYDFEVYRLLPRKWEFENPQDRLFRSKDGRTLFWGPSSYTNFFVIKPDHQVTHHQSPSLGKAYMNAAGDFALWYESLDQGIHFENRDPLYLESPLRSRFGVSYDLEYSYLYEAHQSKIFEGLGTNLVIQLDRVYTYKVVNADDQLWVFGFSHLGHEAIRKHVVVRFQWINDSWLEMERFELPNHLTLMDVDPYSWKALLLNEAEIAPQAFEMNLRNKQIRGLGLVEEFAIYLHQDFRKKAESLELSIQNEKK